MEFIFSVYSLFIFNPTLNNSSQIISAGISHNKKTQLLFDRSLILLCREHLRQVSLEVMLLYKFKNNFGVNVF